jgi:polysaccharide pyruvyl transferase WcaK-like protein
MRPLRIAQLASFRGNIGDNANVVGTRALLRRNLGCEIEFTDLEYLEYEPDPRWGGRKFDEAFADIANAHDLLMIGGGGFFELAVDRSATGTPIDLSVEILDRIEVPIVFYALGFHVSYGICEARTEKFRAFLNYLQQRRDVLISVRNDGSLDTLRSVLGEAYARQVDKVPDGGFFTQPVSCEHAELPPDGRRIAINLAGDGLCLRFHERGPTEHTNCDKFLERFAAVMNGLFRKREAVHAILVPHIPEDLAIIARFMQKVGPPFCRKRITVAPYIHGEAAQGYVFDLYSKCDAVIGMRFHANVCPIGLGVPTIGLITYPQVENLYQELGMPERSLRADADDFQQRVGEMIEDMFVNGAAITDRYRMLTARLEEDVSRFHARIRELVRKNERK